MTNRIYLKLKYYLNELIGFIFNFLEKNKLLKPFEYLSINAKNDVIKVTHKFPDNFKNEHTNLFDEWKEYSTFENKIFNVNDVFVSYQGIISKNYRCFVNALPHPVFKNKFGFPFNLHQLFFSKCIRLSDKEKYIIVHDMWSYANYYHWIIDSLCRIEYWKDELINYILIIHEDSPTYIKDTLHLYRFKNIVTINKKTRLFVPNLFIPNYCAWSGQQHPNVLKNVKQHLLNHFIGEYKYERIYISRRNQKRRRVANEDAVIESLKKYNFEIIYFEGLSIKEQIAISRNSKFYITSHGANLTNAIFMTNGVILELLRNDKPNFCYWSTLTGMGLNYNYQLCNVVNHDDLFVDINEFEKNIMNILNLK